MSLFSLIGLWTAAAAGIDKTIKAEEKNSRAKEISESANDKIYTAMNRLEEVEKQCENALNNLGMEKIFILNNSVKEFLVSFEKIKNIEYSDIRELNEWNKFNLDEKTYDELKEMEELANGQVLLGYIDAGASALSGVIAEAKASKNLDNAYANEAKAEEICEQLKIEIKQYEAVRRAAYMFYTLLVRLDTYFYPLIYQLEAVIDDEGIDYSKFSPSGRNTVSATATIAVTIKTLLDTAVLTNEGIINDDSTSVAKNILEELDKKEEPAVA